MGASAPVRLRTKRCSRIDWTRRGSNGEGKHLDNVNSRAFVVATEQSGRTQAAVWLSQATTSATNHERAFEILMTYRISFSVFLLRSKDGKVLVDCLYFRKRCEL